jgi:hypothetical protein
VIFRVRSAKAVRITDLDLLKRLGFIVGAFAALLLMRTLVAPPPVVVAKSADDLKAFLCRTDWWDHCFSLSKYTFCKSLNFYLSIQTWKTNFTQTYHEVLHIVNLKIIFYNIKHNIPSLYGLSE